MALTPVPGAPAFQWLASSPRVERFGVHRRSVVIKDIAVANHSGLTNTPTLWGTGVLAEGSVMSLGTDGNWYIYGVTLPTTTPATTQAFLTLAAGGVPQMCILIDPIDTTINGAGNPVMGQAYFSGDFLLSFLQFAVGTSFSATGAGSIGGFMRANDLIIEGTTQVIPGTYPGQYQTNPPGYGYSIPREDAPV